MMCPITLTYSELNNYSVLNDRAHLQKKLNEQKETGMKWRDSNSWRFLCAWEAKKWNEAIRCEMRRFGTLGGKLKKLGWRTKIVRGLNRTAHKWRELQHHLIAIYGVPKET